MALAVVNGVSAFASSANAATTTGISITSGNLIVVATANFDPDGLNEDVSVTDSSGNTYTRIAATAVDTSRHESLWYAKNVTGGASVTFTYNITPAQLGFPRLSVIQISGADITAPLDQGANASFTDTALNTSTLTSPTITTLQAAEILICAAADSNTTDTLSLADGGAANNSGTWTLDQSNQSTGGGLSNGIGHAIVAATGSYAVTMTCPTVGGLYVGIASFKAAAGATAATRDTGGRLRLRPGVSSGPSADIAIGNWTTQTGATTGLFSTVDETIPNDADYIQSGSSPTADVVILQLPALQDPGVDDGYRLRIRAGVDFSSVMSVTATIQAGATDIASRTFSGLQTTVGEYQFVMTPTEVQSLRANGGFANPRVKFSATQS